MNSSRPLQLTELRSRAARIRLVLTDVDGVLTDTGVYYSDQGEVMKRFSIRDGMGVERLRNADVDTGIITGERSESVSMRAHKLQIRHLFLGAKDKRAHLEQILSETGLSLEALAYIGDDVNDLGIMSAIGEVGLVACPADAMPEVAELVHHTTSAPGGHGAFRGFADWILELRGAR